MIARHVTDERLHTALHGQGLIGTFAGPRDPGTAAIHAHHCMGTLDGRAGAWGYVEGGMGQVSFALADAAVEAGALLAAGVQVAEIVPGEGVRLAGGELIHGGGGRLQRRPEAHAGAVPARVGPRRLRRAGGGLALRKPRGQAQLRPVPPAPLHRRRARAERAGQSSRPGPGHGHHHHRRRRHPGGLRGGPPGRAVAGVVRAVLPERLRPVDRSARPHTMSVFAQFVPFTLAAGDWESRREEIGDTVIAAIARFAPDVAECIVHRQVLGPPDVEAQVGLTGGHIFQGECLPDQMWDRRFGPRTPIPGLYLCGAATHPGGSVIAANGRNAAMAVLADSRYGDPG